MTKLIIEMKMPKNCPCELSAEVFDPFGNYGGHQPCFAWYGIRARSKEFDRCVVKSERPDWCPIKGVLPEEHGDLIDRSLLCADLAGVILSHSGLGVDEVIARQNAVIEAERKKE